MLIATFVYERYLASRGIRKRGWSWLRKTLIKILNDPICTMSVHDRRLKIHLSHSLPSYLKHHPFYDRLPRRISEFIYTKQRHLTCVDIGANVGDSIAAFFKGESDRFLAIEPNERFFKLLVENWSWNRNVTLLSVLCSASRGEGTYVIQETGGTASILEDGGGLKMRRRPLDEIVADYPGLGRVDVVKIDTDGHDYQVIKGSVGLLSEQLPIVLFECDAFANSNYVEDCNEILQLLSGCGYKQFLVYDNFGYLMGRYSLDDLRPFRNLLFFQLTSPFYYFDILVMKEEDLRQFYKAEISFFVGKMPNRVLQRTAFVAAEP